MLKYDLLEDYFVDDENAIRNLIMEVEDLNNLVPKIRHCKDSILLLITIRHFQRALEKDTEDDILE